MWGIVQHSRLRRLRRHLRQSLWARKKSKIEFIII
jgi:hypothetical protein